MLFYIAFFFSFICLTLSYPVYLSEQSTTQPTQEECLEYLVGNATNVAKEQLFRDKKALDAKDEKILETFGKSVRGVHRKMGVNDLNTLSYALERISKYYEYKRQENPDEPQTDRARPSGDKGKDGVDETPKPVTEDETGSTEAPKTGPEGENGSTEAPKTGPEGETGSTEAPKTGPEGETGSTEAPQTGPEGENGSTEAPKTGPEGETGSTEAPKTGPEGENGSTEAPKTGPEGQGGGVTSAPAVDASQNTKATGSNEATNEPETTNAPSVTTANTTNSSSATAVEVTRKKRENGEAQPTGVENPEDKDKNGAITEQSEETKKEYIEKPREPREDVITKLYMLILNDFYPKEQTEDKAQFLSVMTLLFKDAYRLEQHMAVEHSLRNYYMQLKMALLD